MMAFPPWGLSPPRFTMIPAQARNRMRMRVGPFTWELRSWPSSGRASLCPFPIGTAQHQYFRQGTVCKIRPPCGDHSPYSSAASQPSIPLQGRGYLGSLP